MHGIMMLALESPYSHEHLCTGLTRCPRCSVVIKPDCEIEIDQEPAVLLLSEDDISIRDIAVENASI